MKKSTVKNAATILALAIGAVCLLCIGFAPQISAITNPSIRMPPESLQLNPENVTLNDSYYNISEAVLNTGATATLLQKFLVYSLTNASEGISATKENSPDMTVYFNGTAENWNQLNYNFKSGDNLQVNCLIPSTEYASNTTMSATIYTSQAIYFTEFLLP
jgi:hypothetical protein